MSEPTEQTPDIDQPADNKQDNEQVTQETQGSQDVIVHEVETPRGAVDTGRRVDVSNAPSGPSITLRRRRHEPNHNDNAQEKNANRNERPEGRRGRRPRDPFSAKNDSKSAEQTPQTRPETKPAYTNGVIAVDTPVETEVSSVVHAPTLRPEPKEWDESGDFAAMLNENGPIKKLDIEVGSRVRARLIYLSKEIAFFALGPKHEGAMSLAELLDANGKPTVKIGDSVDAYVVGIDETIHLSKRVGRFAADLGMLEDAKANRIPVEGKITSVNSGGVEVALAGAKGFCPIGQVDIHFIEDPSSLVGKTFSFLVTQISGGGRNVVLNRRALLERERNEKAKERLTTLNMGERVTGTISRTADFGAFVDLGGVEGLIPISELGFGHLAKVEERVNVGDQVTVEVMRIEPDPKRKGQMRISLSLKAAMPDPFEAYGQYLVAGASLEGKVARLESYGAFVELFPGIDGLIHISEMSEQRVRHPSEVLKAGDPVTVRVLEVDLQKRRISLSLRENVERSSKASQGPTMKRGDRVDGVVERIEQYGVFVKFSGGQTALLPASETGQPRGADLGKTFPIGSNLSLMVIDVDDRGRIRVSKIARDKAEENDLVKGFTSKQKQTGFGTLGDLLQSKIK